MKPLIYTVHTRFSKLEMREHGNNPTHPLFDAKFSVLFLRKPPMFAAKHATAQSSTATSVNTDANEMRVDAAFYRQTAKEKFAEIYRQKKKNVEAA